MSAHAEEIARSRLNNSEFSLQVNESIDIRDRTQLLIFICVIDQGQTINKIFYGKVMPQSIRGQDVFNVLTTCYRKWIFS